MNDPLPTTDSRHVDHLNGSSLLSNCISDGDDASAPDALAG